MRLLGVGYTRRPRLTPVLAYWVGWFRSAIWNGVLRRQASKVKATRWRSLGAIVANVFEISNMDKHNQRFDDHVKPIFSAGAVLAGAFGTVRHPGAVEIRIDGRTLGAGPSFARALQDARGWKPNQIAKGAHTPRDDAGRVPQGQRAFRPEADK